MILCIAYFLKPFQSIGRNVVPLYMLREILDQRWVKVFELLPVSLLGHVGVQINTRMKGKKGFQPGITTINNVPV